MEAGQPASRNLARLYESLFTAVVRLKSGRMAFSQPEEVRRKIEHTLESIRRDSTRHGYDDATTEDAQFAAVAFIDEAVSPMAEAGDTGWAPLQQTRFNTLNAGEQFFDRLVSNLQKSDSPATADVLEVFALCLQLGFEGKYADNKTQLSKLVHDATGRVRKIRQTTFSISPDGNLGDEKTVAPPSQVSRRQQLLLRALIALPLLMLVFWLGFKLHLNSRARSVPLRTLEVVSSPMENSAPVGESEARGR